MNKIVLEPQNPLDLTFEEVQDLAKVIAESEPEYDVVVGGEGFAGPAISMWEVLFVWLPPLIGQEVVKVVVKKIVDSWWGWARERIKRDPKRPRSVKILDDNGKVIGAYAIRNATSEPEDQRSKEDPMEPPRMRPKLG